jgi:hypothetical protein
MIRTLMGAAIRCDCGRQLTPSGGERVVQCHCGRIWQALVHTRTTGATAWIPSAGAPERTGSSALAVLRSISGRIFLVPALRKPGRARTRAGRRELPATAGVSAARPAREGREARRAARRPSAQE